MPPTSWGRYRMMSVAASRTTFWSATVAPNRCGRLRGLPALLATVPPTVLEEEPENPPASLLPVLLDRVRRSRRRRRLIITAVAGVAAACVVLALVLAWPSSQNATSPPTPNPGER